MFAIPSEVGYVADLGDRNLPWLQFMELVFEFFLGGYDLEMITIRDLLHDFGLKVHDFRLGWGAKASDYRDQIESTIQRGKTPVLVELLDDIGLSNRSDVSIVIVDHHGDRAGFDSKTSLEQVFQLLRLPDDKWTRHLQLVAANDRGHVQAMHQLGATLEEMNEIRAADRRAQAITSDQELAGQRAIDSAQRVNTACGELVILKLPHNRTATVTDSLERLLGGTGYENLLVHCPNETSFFGSGRIVNALDQKYPGGWRGGELPIRGFWGIQPRIPVIDVEKELIGTMQEKQADEIDVRAFHHTLVWPLIMRGPGSEHEPEASIDRFVSAFGDSGWKEIGKDSSRVDKDYTYEEVVYFHPFVRDFLFGDGVQKPEKRARRRFQRNDLEQLRVKIKTDKGNHFEVTLRVERVEMILTKPRIAMLLIEVSNRHLDSSEVPPDHEPEILDPRSSLKLSEAMYLQARLRTVFPPYFDQNDQHGNCASEVEWLGSRAPAIRHTQTHAGDFREFTRTGAEPPIFAHWQLLFDQPDGNHAIEPLRSAKDIVSGKVFFQQLLDDRMPALSFIAVDDPNEIRTEDEDCLPGFDTPGFVYDSDTRDRERESFRYTRFRHWGSTYYCNGTSFTAVCPNSEFSNLLLTHFRRHYTHLAMIAQYQHAALLYFADQLAIVSREMALDDDVDSKEERRWQKHLTKIQNRFLKFRTRCYFTEVSNHVQAKDLFSMWFELLGTERLFERVSQTSNEVYEVVENREVKQLTIAQMYLSKVAALGLTASIFLAVASFIVALAGLFSGGGSSGSPWGWVIASLIVGFVSALAFWFLVVGTDSESKTKKVGS